MIPVIYFNLGCIGVKLGNTSIQIEISGLFSMVIVPDNSPL